MGFNRSPNGSFHQYSHVDGPSAPEAASAVGSPPGASHHLAAGSYSMARRLTLPFPGGDPAAPQPQALYDGFTSCFDPPSANMAVPDPEAVRAEEPGDDFIDVDAIMAEEYPMLQLQFQQHEAQMAGIVKVEPSGIQPSAMLRRAALTDLDFSKGDDRLPPTSPTTPTGHRRRATPMDTRMEEFPLAMPRGLERQDRPLSMPVELESPGAREAYLLHLLEEANPPPPWPPLQDPGVAPHHQRSLPSQHRYHHPYQPPSLTSHLHHRQVPHRLPSALSTSPASSSAASSAAASPTLTHFAPGTSHSFPRMQRLRDVPPEIFLGGNERPVESSATSPSPIPSPGASDGTSPAPGSPSTHGERTHRCDQCGDLFANKWTLARHKRNIHGGKRYKCRFCDERFNASHTRNRHETNIHQDSLKVTCKDNWCRCKKKFQNETQLRNHLFQKRKARGGMAEEQLKSATF